MTAFLALPTLIRLNISIEIIQTFLNAGANPNPAYDDRNTLIHKLARQWPCRLDVVKMRTGSHILDVVNQRRRNGSGYFQAITRSTQKRMKLKENIPINFVKRWRLFISILDLCWISINKTIPRKSLPSLRISSLSLNQLSVSLNDL